MERPNTETVRTKGSATVVWRFLHRKIIVLGAHTQGGKKNILFGSLFAIFIQIVFTQ